MKKIKIASQYERYYKKYVAKNELLRKQVGEVIEIFFEDRNLVNDHPLTGKLFGYRSFYVNESYRIVYIETDRLYVFLRIGPHEIVYK